MECGGSLARLRQRAEVEGYSPLKGNLVDQPVDCIPKSRILILDIDNLLFKPFPKLLSQHSILCTVSW